MALMMRLTRVWRPACTAARGQRLGHHRAYRGRAQVGCTQALNPLNACQLICHTPPPRNPGTPTTSAISVLSTPNLNLCQPLLHLEPLLSPSLACTSPALDACCCPQAAGHRPPPPPAWPAPAAATEAARGEGGLAPRLRPPPRRGLPATGHGTRAGPLSHGRGRGRGRRPSQPVSGGAPACYSHYAVHACGWRLSR